MFPSILVLSTHPTIGYRKTPYMGLKVDVETIKGLVEELIIKEKQPYLLTYRLCQDNLELFFNSVRRAGRL